MSRKLSEAHSHRPFLSMIAGLMSFAAVTACGAKADTGSTGTTSDQEQALTEAQTSYADAKQAAEACFTAFEACKSASGADVAACATQLHDCLPAQAGPGPHCGGPPPPPPGGPMGGDCKGGPPDGNGGPPPPPPPGTDPGAGAPPPPPPGGGAPPPPPPVEGGKPGGPPPGGPGGPPPDGDGKGHPGFCKHVPLPPPPELKACHDAAHACVAGGGDRKACFDADRACVKAAFDAAFEKLCATNDGTNERLTKLCAGGIAPPAP